MRSYAHDEAHWFTIAPRMKIGPCKENRHGRKVAVRPAGTARLDMHSERCLETEFEFVSRGASKCLYGNRDEKECSQ